MELGLPRIWLPDELPASRRWPREEWAAVLALAQGASRPRHLSAITAIVVLIALMVASPQL
jgi:hypothetical protein